MKRIASLALIALLLPACRQDMHDQPKYDPLEKSDFFANGMAARPNVKGTIARGELDRGDLLERGRVDGELATENPLELTRELLARGQQRYNIFCTPCHDRLGNGNGVIVQRGLKRPTSFHDPRLVNSPPGYYFDVITNGYGIMYDYSDKIEPDDRWAITAYIRALQVARSATIEDVPPEERSALERLRESQNP